jgi:hypothetical protein
LNSGRLVINGGVTQLLTVNKGTKEGGINSPPIFNSAYVTVLQRLNISEYPASAQDIDRNKVYYVVFADDLVLVSANLSRLETETNRLSGELKRLGMQINADKTKWMMFLPLVATEIPQINSLKLYLGDVELELVSEFTYLGFTIDSYASLASHVIRREKLLLTAASISGRLMRQLEVTNTQSLRSYFYSLVSSQLYGLGVTAFSEQQYIRAQKVFLQEAWLLPKSFPLNMASFILGVEDLEIMALRARMRFLQHLLTSNRTRASLSAMVLDRSELAPRRSGWNHDVMAMFPSILGDLETIDLTSPRAVRILYAKLARILACRQEACANSIFRPPSHGHPFPHTFHPSFAR